MQHMSVKIFLVHLQAACIVYIVVLGIISN